MTRDRVLPRPPRWVAARILDLPAGHSPETTVGVGHAAHVQPATVSALPPGRVPTT